MSTYVPQGQEIQRKWYLVDATGIPVGRLSSAVAEVLSGKRKPTWTPFIDTGDHVVVINASKAVFTGKTKLADTPTATETQAATLTAWQKGLPASVQKTV